MPGCPHPKSLKPMHAHRASSRAFSRAMKSSIASKALALKWQNLYLCRRVLRNNHRHRTHQVVVPAGRDQARREEIGNRTGLCHSWDRMIRRRRRRWQIYSLGWGCVALRSQPRGPAVVTPCRCSSRATVRNTDILHVVDDNVAEMLTT